MFMLSKNMNFIKYLCCCFINNNDEIKYEPKQDEFKLHKIKQHHKTKLHKPNIVKSNTIHFHELDCKTVEDIKRFTIVTDINGNTVIKPYSFIYLGYPFIESDTE